jgi:peptidoglycan/xylan/chitin deacetylase (PgdA/CDA1 family)
VSHSPRIPVVMFHSVNDADPGWLWDELTCSIALFERKIAALRGAGYRAAGLDEVHGLQAAGRRPTDRSVVLTFDDGYLDNWVYVYPILKRAGWKGIVYVNPEFVDPGETVRPNLEDVWAGRCAASDLRSTGFLNWAEIRRMDQDGVLEIASHSMSHTWYPTGPGIEDFHRPGLDTPWLAWNARPDRKPFYRLEDQAGFVPWGTPIHSNGRSLGIRRYFPDPDIAPAVTAHVAAHGGAAYFEETGWRETLLEVAAEADRGTGREESDEEMLARFNYELGEASLILEERLGHAVPHFCWPGGAYCDASWDVAAAMPFQTLTVKRSDRKRWGQSDPRLVRRISEFRGFSMRGRHFETSDPHLLPIACDVELGRPGAGLRLKARKAMASLGLV